MSKIKNFLLSNSAVICAAACLLFYFTYIQFISATFYDPDSYYHAAVTNFIKNSGFRYQFHWAQFSVFKDFFSDKDFLFHLLAVPCFYLTDNLVTAGKYATIFYNCLFIFVYAFILRRYLSDFLAALFLLLPALSSTFVAFFTQFRSVTLSNILTLLAIYFMTNKNLAGVFIISLLYPLAHISFFMLIPFVLICEIIRYAVNKEFSLRNLYTVLIGTLLGMFIHPNFPNNFLSFHLNGVLVPIYTITKVKMDFGGEFNSPLTNFAFINNFTVFFIFNFVLWVSLFAKKKWNFSTLVWLGCSNVYLALSFFSNRYWYPTNVLFYVFFAAYVRDITEGMEWKRLFRRVSLFTGLYLAANLVVFPMNLKNVDDYIYFFTVNNMQYEKAAEWMKRNIPAGETVYHASWSDSPYFICLNPKNNYLNVLDPIYMFYRYPGEFALYQDLIWGRIEKPYEALRQVFKVNYGFTRKETPLSFQIREDPKHFKIVYENNMGFVFKLI
jgi:hypothetical protein